METIRSFIRGPGKPIGALLAAAIICEAIVWIVTENSTAAIIFALLATYLLVAMGTLFAWAYSTEDEGA